MGQEHSSLIDDSIPPQVLKDRSINSIATYVRQGHAKKIVMMVGAGISTSAGIPDFRSPDTGLYANLARLNLPFAEAVFDISYFRSNPLPFYALAHELYPGKFRPTISHSFIRLLSDKGILLKLFTQNIDCLERTVGVPDDKIVEAHGSFARQSCVDCHTSFPEDLMKQAIDAREVPYCQTPQCNGLVKPDIVFFGEQLPESFRQSRSLPMEADLCIIMGTSLSVQPFASLPGFVPDHVPRLLINHEIVGDLGSHADDVLLLGDCDTGVRTFASALGWEEDLEIIWNATRADRQEEEGSKAVPHKSKDEMWSDEVASLAAEVEKSLQVSADHRRSLQDLLKRTEQQENVDEPDLLEVDVRSSRDSDAPVFDEKINKNTETLPREEEIHSKRTVAGIEEFDQRERSEMGFQSKESAANDQK